MRKTGFKHRKGEKKKKPKSNQKPQKEQKKRKDKMHFERNNIRHQKKHLWNQLESWDGRF